MLLNRDVYNATNISIFCIIQEPKIQILLIQHAVLKYKINYEENCYTELKNNYFARVDAALELFISLHADLLLISFLITPRDPLHRVI